MNPFDEYEKLNQTAKLLTEWYEANARMLPWRENRDPYRIWISEIMLQQTRISAVLEYYARFMKRLPTIDALADIDEEELLKLWQGLGYYNRARNLQKTAKILQQEHQSSFPESFEQIRNLPGIGDYTAGAISSIAFGICVPAVDGNVLRVLTRILGDESDIAKEQTKKLFAQKLLPVIPEGHAGSFNQGIMELGELICLPNGEPLCETCPVKELCTAYAEGLTGVLPVKSKAKARTIEERNVFLIRREGCVAIRKRPAKGLLSGLWEFPNQLAEQDPQQTLEEWGIKASPSDLPVITGKHIFSHIEWHMTARSYQAETVQLPEGWVWASPEDLKEIYAIPTAFQFVLPKQEAKE